MKASRLPRMPSWLPRRRRPPTPVNPTVSEPEPSEPEAPLAPGPVVSAIDMSNVTIRWQGTPGGLGSDAHFANVAVSKDANFGMIALDPGWGDVYLVSPGAVRWMRIQSAEADPTPSPTLS